MRLTQRFAAAAVVVLGVSLTSPALAEAPSYVKTQPPKVQITSFGESSGEATSGSSAASGGGSGSSGSSLAVTGGDIVGLIALGLGFVGGGVAVRRLGRGRAHPHPA